MKKHLFPLELDQLDPAQLCQFHSWLDEFSYKIVQQKLSSEFNIHMSITRLSRYNQRRELGEEVAGQEEILLDTKALHDLLNGAPVAYDEATLQLMSKRVFQVLLGSPDISITQVV